MPPRRLEDAIQAAARQFASEIITLIRQATVEELTGLATVTEPTPRKRPGRPRRTPTSTAARVEPRVTEAAPGKAEAEDAPRAAAEAPAAIKLKAKPTKKKRSWPTCTVDGCGKNAYGPSRGKYCYRHHLENGGQASPFARKRRAMAKAEPAVEKLAPQRKTIRRKAGSTGSTEVEAVKKAVSTKPDQRKRVEVLRELERAGKP